MRNVTRSFLIIGIVLAAGAEQALAQSIVVEESAVATAVEDRMPVNPDSTFSVDVERLYFWTRISGAPTPDGTTIHHVWFYGDQEMADLELRVGGSPWRTWSNKRILPEWTGDWHIEVRDAAGNVVETVRFTVGG